MEVSVSAMFLVFFGYTLICQYFLCIYKSDYASDNSVLYLVLEIIGLGIIVYALIQNSLNNQVTNE